MGTFFIVDCRDAVKGFVQSVFPLEAWGRRGYFTVIWRFSQFFSQGGDQIFPLCVKEIRRTLSSPPAEAQKPGKAFDRHQSEPKKGGSASSPA